MIRKLLGVVLIAALSLTLAAPAFAGKGHGGGFHGGSHHGFHHHGFHHCCFGPAFFGGVFVASSVAFPLSVYPYYYPYPYMYPAYPPPVYEQAPPAVQRDVCYVEGCYHLEGDGVTSAYQWIWIPSAPAPPPPPPPP